VNGVQVGGEGAAPEHGPGHVLRRFER